MKRILLCLFLAGALGACSPIVPTDAPATSVVDPVSAQSPQASAAPKARTDEQGMVVVEVTPLDLGTSGGTLEFNVVMNTHSVDLSMDLAALASLTTDTGEMVQAVSWDGPLGGHHVSGTLSFPTVTSDGKSLLDGAGRLTLSLADLDVPLREFVWDLK